MTENKKFLSVWDALEDTPQEAASMKARSALMMAVSQLIEDKGLNQSQAASLLGVSQPRISDLIRGKIHLFSLDTLMDMATAAGLVASLQITQPQCLPA